MDIQFSLRWRTESEVLSGAGETTCGNTRCPHHSSSTETPNSPPRVSLSTLELPFAYEEHSETKTALVKVVLCPRCCKKLMWKRNHDKERNPREGDEMKIDSSPRHGQRTTHAIADDHIGGLDREESHSKSHRPHGRSHRRDSRSRSPIRRKESSHHSRRHRSP